MAMLTHDSIAIEVIRRHLWSETFGCHIYVFGEVASTNDVMRGLAEAGAQEGTVVLADSQRLGRGQSGRPWFSPPGVNVHLSVLLRPGLPVRRVPVFSFVASLALAEAIRLEGLGPTIKWPNDVLVDGKKVAGALAECATSGERVDYVILSLGVNVNADAATLAQMLGDEAAGATSLREAAGREIDRNAFIARLLNLLDKWVQVYAAGGAEALLRAWRRWDALAGRRVSVRSEPESLVARVVGVDDDGRLLLEEAGGRCRPVVAGEIRLVD